MEAALDGAILAARLLMGLIYPPLVRDPRGFGQKGREQEKTERNAISKDPYGMVNH